MGSEASFGTAVAYATQLSLEDVCLLIHVFLSLQAFPIAEDFSSNA
jgi:hypothetical protein